MYLSNGKVRILRDTIEVFEVSYRSYIADIILNKYKTKQEFVQKLEEIRISLSEISSLILITPLKKRIDTYKNGEWKIYEALQI